MKTLTLLINLICLTSFSKASDKAIDLANLHMRHIVSVNTSKLTETYASTVHLMEGHDLLKKVLVSKVNDSSKSLEISSKDIAASIDEFIKGRKPPTADYVKSVLSHIQFKEVKTNLGENIIEVPQPKVDSQRKLKLFIKKGDILLMSGDNKYDVYLLHLRKIEGKWKVVSEYID